MARHRRARAADDPPAHLHRDARAGARAREHVPKVAARPVRRDEDPDRAHADLHEAVRAVVGVFNYVFGRMSGV